jgi:hypothetical protein
VSATRYETPEVFRPSLEARLPNAAFNGTNLARRRQMLVFDRFLARIGIVLDDAVTLKGGVVLERWLHIDLRLAGGCRPCVSDCKLLAEWTSATS